jgi:hypothetical protein
VTGDAGKDRHHLLLDQVVTPTDYEQKRIGQRSAQQILYIGKTIAHQEQRTTTSEDLDDDLPLLRLLHLDIDHFEGLALFLLLKGLVSLGKRHCGSDF